jgi:hypothetical protein
MTARLKPVGILVVVSLAMASLSASRQEVTLAYRWTKGEPALHRVTQEVTTTMSGVPGVGDMTITQTIAQVLRSVAEAIADDGTATLRQTIESIRMEMGTPMGKMGYDSSNPEAIQDPTGMMKDMFSAMIGEPFTVVLAPTGRVEKVEGMSRLMDKMIKVMPQNPGGGPALDVLKSSLNDEAMRGLLGQGFAQFPGKPVRVGEAWNGELKTRNPTMGVLATATVFSLKAIEGSGATQVAKVGMKLTMKQEDPSGVQNSFGFTVQLGESAGDGELSFDVAKGRLLRSSLQIDMPFTMSGAGPDGTSMTVASKAKATTTVEAVEK